MARAAAAAGTIMCLSTIATSTPAEVAAAAPEAPRWFQLYVFRDRRRHPVPRRRRPSSTATARSSSPSTRRGSAAASATCAPASASQRRSSSRAWLRSAGVGGARRRSSCSARSTRRSAGAISTSSRSLAPLPLVLKGIQTAEDAALACRARRRRNRRLEPRRPPARRRCGDRRPAARDRRRGRRADRGATSTAASAAARDVVKALALGARAVLAGRAPLWGLACDGEDGARRVLELLRDEIELALALCGCTSPEQVAPEHVP